MKLKFAVLLTSLAMIIINILANLIPYNNQTTAQISDSFKVYFVPAGYVFAIWGVIYLGIVAFNIFMLMPKQKNNKNLRKILPAVIIGNIANSIWIFLWHYNHPVWCVPVMIVLLISLVYVYLNFNIKKDLTKSEYFLVKIPFTIYLGWISVATIANITDALYAKGFDGFGISGAVWASILVVVAATLALILLLRYRDIAYASVIIWATIGIAVKFQDIGILNTTSYLASLVVLVVVVYTVYKKFLVKS